MYKSGYPGSRTLERRLALWVCQENATGDGLTGYASFTGRRDIWCRRSVLDALEMGLTFLVHRQKTTGGNENCVLAGICLPCGPSQRGHDGIALGLSGG